MSFDGPDFSSRGEKELSSAAAETTARPEAHLDEWVAPDIADERGFLRAGKIFEWMDVVGVLTATRHARHPVVTASVDGMQLREPIRIGERVTMTAAVGHTSRASIGVSVSMTHGLPAAGTPKRLLAGHMTFVALDESGNALPVPQLQPETPDEVARFREGQLRREFRKKLLSGELPALQSTTDGATPHMRALLVRELLKFFPRSFPFPFDRVDYAKPRRRHLSYVHKIEPIRSSKLNFHGTLYGGTLMRWIETSANLSARVPERSSGALHRTSRVDLHQSGATPRLRAHPLRGGAHLAGLPDRSGQRARRGPAGRPSARDAPGLSHLRPHRRLGDARSTPGVHRQRGNRAVRGGRAPPRAAAIDRRAPGRRRHLIDHLAAPLPRSSPVTPRGRAWGGYSAPRTATQPEAALPQPLQPPRV